MKLWEAMLKGAKQGPQIFGNWHDGSNGTCAMGAVMVGCGFDMWSEKWYESFKETHKLFPELLEQSFCPVSDGCLNHMTTRLEDVIIHLNDKHAWSRQKIAEWIRSGKVEPVVEVKELVVA